MNFSYTCEKCENSFDGQDLETYPPVFISKQIKVQEMFKEPVFKLEEERETLCFDCYTVEYNSDEYEVIQSMSGPKTGKKKPNNQNIRNSFTLEQDKLESKSKPVVSQVQKNKKLSVKKSLSLPKFKLPGGYRSEASVLKED